MPVDDGGLHPKAFDVAGDYIFTTMVAATKQKPALVSVWRLSDGKLVGTMSPGPEVGGNNGWTDIPYGLRAMKTTDGEYRITVEEGLRGKVLVYRWKPDRR
jgi:hypothetical protein